MFCNMYSCAAAGAGVSSSSPSSDDVFLQQLLDDVDDVGNIDFVDQTIDGLLQSLPAHPLIGQAAEGRGISG